MREPHSFEVAESLNNSSSGRLGPEERLARWARRQHRQVTTAQLRAVGWESDDVAYRVKVGRLHPVFAEVYSLGGPPQTEKERWMAATLTFGRGAVLSHGAAAELYELLRYPLNEIHVTTPTKRRDRQGIVAHHRANGFCWRYVDHIPVTSPEQTILDCATMVANPKAYRRIVRQAQVDGLTTHARLHAFVAQNPGRRGVAHLKAQLADGPSPTRSGFEDEVLEIFRNGGSPLVNHVIDGDELDLFFPKLGIGIEVDGSPHENPTAKADDGAKQQRLQRRGVKLLRVS